MIVKRALPYFLVACSLSLLACDGSAPEAHAADHADTAAPDPAAAAEAAEGEDHAGSTATLAGLAAGVPATATAGDDRRVPLTPYHASTGPAAAAPPILRGIYLNAYAAGSRNRLAALLELAARTEINAFVVDVKDERGIHYDSDIPLARQLAQPGENTLRNLSAFVERLHEHGIWSMARIVVFKDPILSAAKPEWSIRTPSGEVWVDRAGHTWVSPWDPDVWEYNLAIAEEAARAGFREIQFDYIRFPEPYASLPDQVHPKAQGDRTQAIVAFLDEARRRLHPLGAVVSADVFGLSPNDPRDINIGQQWEELLAAADHLLPMVYPSHYFPTHLRGVPQPNRMPYETVYASVGMGIVRVRRMREAGLPTARVVPWLQAFNAPWVDRDVTYGPAEAAAQIRAVHDVGLEDWIFWHPGSRYEQIADAFARELRPAAVAFDALPAVEQHVDVLERQGVRAARERVEQRINAGARAGSNEEGGA